MKDISKAKSEKVRCPKCEHEMVVPVTEKDLKVICAECDHSFKLQYAVARNSSEPDLKNYALTENDSLLKEFSKLVVGLGKDLSNEFLLPHITDRMEEIRREIDKTLKLLNEEGAQKIKDHAVAISAASNDLMLLVDEICVFKRESEERIDDQVGKMSKAVEELSSLVETLDDFKQQIVDSVDKIATQIEEHSGKNLKEMKKADAVMEDAVKGYIKEMEGDLDKKIKSIIQKEELLEQLFMRSLKRMNFLVICTVIAVLSGGVVWFRTTPFFHQMTRQLLDFLK